MPGTNYQTVYEIYVMNFTEPTNFPFTVAIYTTGTTPVATIPITANGQYKPSEAFPGTGWYTIDLAPSNLTGSQVLTETVVLQSNDQMPPFVPTSGRYIRVVVRNIPIVGQDNGDNQGENEDEDGN